MTHLGIDAFNIKEGGGLTHLTMLLKYASQKNRRISRVTLWVSAEVAYHIEKKPWLKIISPNWMSKNLLIRLWKRKKMHLEFLKEGCDSVFFPGGILTSRINSKTVPYIALSQNLLPFEPNEARLFGAVSFLRAKMYVLRMAQKKAFKNADAIIFLTKYANRVIESSSGTVFKEKIIIPHGIEDRFFCKPRKQRSIESFSIARPLKLLYISVLLPYKHQIEVSQAVKRLRDMNLPVEITFIGRALGLYGAKFKRHINTLDPQRKFIKFIEEVPFSRLHKLYASADIFVFASSCENLPNILLEAMASGLPIASSFNGPMPEILGDGAMYFDPYSEDSIYQALKEMVMDVKKRQQIAEITYDRSLKYSWEECANQTFSFANYITNKIK